VLSGLVRKIRRAGPSTPSTRSVSFGSPDDLAAIEPLIHA